MGLKIKIIKLILIKSMLRNIFNRTQEAYELRIKMRNANGEMHKLINSAEMGKS